MPKPNHDGQKKNQVNCRFKPEMTSEIDRRRGKKSRAAFCQDLILDVLSAPEQTPASASVDLSGITTILTEFENQFLLAIDPVVEEIPSILQIATDARAAARVAAKAATGLHGELATAISTILIELAEQEPKQVKKFIAAAFPDVEEM